MYSTHKAFFNYIIDPASFSLDDKTTYSIHNIVQSKLASERKNVEQYINQTDCPSVYGFNTLFGHKDGSSLKDNDQLNLLDKHTLGKDVQIPLSFVQSFLASRMVLLLNGGTGVPLSVVEEIMKSIQDTTNSHTTVAMNLSSTYSCGDVVQNSWLFKYLYENNNEIIDEQGSLMSFINGYSYSTALSIIFCSWFVALMDRFVECLNFVERLFKYEGVQLSVSLRDTSSVRKQIAATVHGIRESLLSRITSQSSNPLFVFNDDNTVGKAVSNSSFLDFDVTISLNNVLDTANIVSAYIQRLAHHYSEHLNKTLPVEDHFIQPSKITLAECFTIQSLSAPIRNVVGMESVGVEDVFDLSAITAQKVGLVNNSLSKELYVLEELIKHSKRDADNSEEVKLFGQGYASADFIGCSDDDCSFPPLQIIEQRGQTLLKLFFDH